jgi:hypothetical protein
MSWQTMAEYGACPCGSRYDSRMVEVRMTVGAERFVLESVPQGACPQCGSRVYKLADLELVERLMHSRR